MRLIEMIGLGRNRYREKERITFIILAPMAVFQEWLPEGKEDILITAEC